MTSAVIMRKRVPHNFRSVLSRPRLNKAHPLAKNLVACWPLILGHEDARPPTAIAEDISGNKRHMNRVGSNATTLNSRRVPYWGYMARGYNSTITDSEYYRVSHNAAFLSARFSFMCGYRRSGAGTGGDHAVIMSKRQSGTSEIRMSTIPSGANHLVHFAVDTTVGQAQAIGPDVVLNQHYWLLGTYDGATIRLYYEGEEVATQAQTGTPTTNVELSLMGASIALNPTGTFDAIRGDLHYAMWWNYAIPAELAARCKDYFPIELAHSGYRPGILHVENPAVGGAFIPAFARNANTLISTGGPM